GGPGREELVTALGTLNLGRHDGLLREAETVGRNGLTAILPWRGRPPPGPRSTRPANPATHGLPPASRASPPAPPGPCSILRAGRHEPSVRSWAPAPCRECETIPLVFVWICRRWLIKSLVRSDGTRPHDAVVAGDRQAAADLLSLVYNELRNFAAARMAAGAPGEGVTC